MRPHQKLRYWLRALLQRETLDTEMEEELRFHVEMQTQANREAGMNPEEARYAALRKFGWMEKIKEEVREERGVRWVEDCVQDMQHAVRTLAKEPGFTLAVLAALGLGIGANCALYSFVHGFLMRPLPFPNLEQVMTLWETETNRPTQRGPVSPANFVDWRTENRSFDHLAAFQLLNANLSDRNEPEQLPAARVSAAFFPTIGLPPLYGRIFTQEAEQPGKDDVVVLSHGLWQRRFAGETNIVGQFMVIDGRHYRILGIMPEDFVFPIPAELWIPLALSPQAWRQRDVYCLQVVGRLKAGASQARARAEMETIGRHLVADYPDTNAGRGVGLVSLRERYIMEGKVDELIFMVLISALLILLLSCTNVAILQLVRATYRQKELAIRAALGASRIRIISQLLTENVLLALCATPLALLSAYCCFRFLKANVPPELAAYTPGLKHLGIDGVVLLLTLVTAVLAGFASGVVPSLAVSRPNLNNPLKESGRGETAGRGRGRLRQTLVVAETAIALALLVDATLIVKSFVHLTEAQHGFNPKNVLTMFVTLPQARYPESRHVADFFDQALNRLPQAPGIRVAAASSALPFDFHAWKISQLEIEARKAAPGESWHVSVQAISPGYFRTLEVPLMVGRSFDQRDNPESQPVAVVSLSVAARFRQDTNVLGKRIRTIGADGESPWLTIVGVVENVKRQWNESNTEIIYRPLFQAPERTMCLLLRSENDPLRLIPTARALVGELDAAQPLSRIRPMSQVVAESMAGVKVLAGGAKFCAALALVLACVGIYSVMAYAVAQRTREIGIRVALGARRGAIMTSVFTGGLRLAVAGILLGLPLAFGIRTMVAGMYFGILAMDGWSVIECAALMTGLALIACLVPAVRATRVDPMIALRAE